MAIAVRSDTRNRPSEADVERGSHLADIKRLLAVIKASEKADYPLETSDLIAACHLLGSEEQHPELAFRYRFGFGSGPESSELYHDLVQLEDAGLARHGSPIHPTPAADAWLKEEGVEVVVRAATACLKSYKQVGQSLALQSIDRERTRVREAVARTDSQETASTTQSKA